MDFQYHNRKAPNTSIISTAELEELYLFRFDTVCDIEKTI